MRELVYVSDAKLRQVLPGLPKASAFRGLEGSLELKGPVEFAVVLDDFRGVRILRRGVVRQEQSHHLGELVPP
ncbi:hypothetical protein ABZ342_29960 [Amycolatopsis sp. NPDC005961]|uniref:hypothetical protein n=1 Tax=Amycolatopsis sp. NPDC005961 TaxID=3156720 RepID=UPI0033CF96CE